MDDRQEALRLWCDQAWPGIYRYIYHHVQNREEAEDLTQETYTRIIARFSSPSDLPSRSYLRTVALNLIRDQWRRQKAHGILLPLEEEFLPGDSEAEAKFDGAVMEELMGKLPQEQRRVLQLRIVEGYSRAATARKMGISEDAVRGLQYRAVQALRSLMHTELGEVDKS